MGLYEMSDVMKVEQLSEGKQNKEKSNYFQSECDDGAQWGERRSKIQTGRKMKKNKKDNQRKKCRE